MLALGLRTNPEGLFGILKFQLHLSIGGQEPKRHTK